MSPEKYPLVLFGGSDKANSKVIGRNGEENTAGSSANRKALDPPPRKGYRPDGNDEDEPVILGNTKETSDPNDSGSLLDICLANAHDLRCLVGVRPIEDDGGYEGRMKRLLEGPKPVVDQETELGSNSAEGQSSVVLGAGGHIEDNSSGLYEGLNEELGLLNTGSTGRSAKLWSTWFTFGMLGSEVAGGGTFWEVAVSLLLGVVSLWFVWKGFRKRTSKAAERKKEKAWSNNQQSLDRDSLPLPELDHNGKFADDTKEFTSPIISSTVFIKELPPLPPLDLHNSPPSEELASVPSPALPDTPIPENADDTEGENEAPITAGKKKVRRGKRGKKKKAGAVTDIAVPDSNEGDQGKEDGPTEKASVVLVTSPRTPLTQPSSLVVSDLILGKFAVSVVKFHELEIDGICTRFWVTRNCCLPRFSSRPICSN